MADIDKDFYAFLREHYAYYECLKDRNGKRLSPLVGYTGRDENGLQFVGETYINMAMIEENPAVLYQLAEKLNEKLIEASSHIDVFCGAPEGGKALALTLSIIRKHAISRPRYVYPDKKTITSITNIGRERYLLSFGRHKIQKEDRVAIVEDVTNNFSTTDTLVELINNSGGIVEVITTLLNRSEKIHGIYESGVQLDNPKIPVISLINEPLQQYEQKDPRVANDIQNPDIGIVLDPKNNWEFLMKQTRQTRTC